MAFLWCPTRGFDGCCPPVAGRHPRRLAARRGGLAAAAIVGLVASVAGCGGHVSAADAFVAGSDTACLAHQSHSPSAAYRGGPSADTGLELRFLRYYTAQGREPFCGSPTPTKDDQAWAALYMKLTGHRVAAVTN